MARPPKFNSPEEMEQVIEDYFRRCQEEDRPITVTGLALALDTNRQTILNYQDRPEFNAIVERAKLRCELYLEERLLSGKGGTAGIMFALKNNFRWQDRTTVEHEGGANGAGELNVLEMTREELLRIASGGEEKEAC